MSDAEMFKAIKFYDELIRCSECGKFKPFPDGIYGECHRLLITTIVKTDDYCSYAVPKDKPLPEYDDHDVSGLIDE